MAVPVVALCCLLPLLPLPAPVAAAHWLGAPVDWPEVALLAFLHGCWESLAQGLSTPCLRLGRLLLRRPPLRARRPVRPGVNAFFPVLFAGVLMLPPAAAALVAVPAALLGAGTAADCRRRQVWNGAQLALSAFAASAVFHLLAGPQLLLGSRFPAALLPAFAALGAFCLVNGALVGGMRLLAEGRRPAGPRRGASAAPELPGVPVLVHAAGGLMLAVLWQGPYGAFAALLALLPLTISAWVFAQGHRERDAHRATVQALVQAVEIKDAYTRGHSERVGRAAVLIADQLGMEAERLRTLRYAGILHDVGKLGVATELLRRNGPLTEEERRAVEVHPVHGYELVRGIAFLGEAHAGILHHHERVDGRGYPAGLAGEQIPEFARIISVADAFDSMTSTRSYRRGRPVAEAVAELERCSGSQFDPLMVRALVAALAVHDWQPVLPTSPDCIKAVPDIPLGVPEPARAAPGGVPGQGGGGGVPTAGAS